MAGHSLSSFGAGIALALFTLLEAHQVAGQPENYRSNRAALAQWIDNTDAQLTFVGAPRGAPFKPFDIQVIWCSEQRGRVCGGNCTIYTGVGDTCLLTQYTASCLAATDNLGYCSRQECRPPCNVYRKCGDPMDNGFCSTPYTNAINIMLSTSVSHLKMFSSSDLDLQLQTTSQMLPKVSVWCTVINRDLTAAVARNPEPRTSLDKTVWSTCQLHC